jgi:hypothetical protein
MLRPWRAQALDQVGKHELIMELEELWELEKLLRVRIDHE